MAADHEAQSRVFKAFCDPTRLRILELLRGGERCVCVLVGQLGIGQSALSYHMKILVESGIVESRQDGKWTHYRISAAGSASAVRLLGRLTECEPEWEDVLAAVGGGDGKIGRSCGPRRL